MHDMTTAASKIHFGEPISTSKKCALLATDGATRSHSIPQGCRASEPLVLAPARPGAAICMRLYGGALNRRSDTIGVRVHNSSASPLWSRATPVRVTFNFRRCQSVSSVKEKEANEFILSVFCEILRISSIGGKLRKILRFKSI